MRKTKTLTILRVAAAVAVLGLPGPPALAQLTVTPPAALPQVGEVSGPALSSGTPQGTAPVSTTFRSAVDLVTLNVTVTDGRQKVVAGLTRDSFQVLEDGTPQDLAYFAATQVPLDVALLVDASASMRDKLPLVQEAAAQFIEVLGGQDRASVAEFNTRMRVLAPFTSDRQRLEAAVKQTTASGSTALYSALYITLDTFRRAATPGEVRRPAIVVLTDGEDTASLMQFDDLLDRARREGVAIYAISVVSPAEGERYRQEGERRFYSASDYALKSLAQETGGRCFFPLALTELNGVYQSVAAELSSQYALGYVPKRLTNDGTYRRLSVRILDHPDARPRTRTGYYVPVSRASLVR